jgi:hypothetical protein
MKSSAVERPPWKTNHYLRTERDKNHEMAAQAAERRKSQKHIRAFRFNLSQKTNPKPMGLRAQGESIMSKLTKVAALAMLVFAATGFATAHLNVTFLDSEGGASYTFDKVIISDGEDVQMFENVDNITAVVPEEFTLTTVYHVASHSNMFEIPLTLDAGETLDLEIYAVDPNTVQGRERPYLAGKEVGTTVDLTWDYSPMDTTLIYWVETSPPERYALVATWVYAATDLSSVLTSSDPLYYKHRYRSNEFEHNGRKIGYKLCNNIIDRFWYHGPILDLEVNTTAFVKAHIKSGKDKIRIVFSKISEARKALGVRRANHKYARVIVEYVLKLRSLNNLNKLAMQDYPPDGFYPQWEVPSETHYILGIEGMPDGFVPLEYPLFVPDTVHSIVTDLYPPKLADLVPDDFFVAGENFYANSSYSNLVCDPGVSMSVDVATEMAFEWWGCFVLSDDYTVDKLYAYPDGIELAENTDYIINPAEGYNLVTVRILPSYGQLVLDYASAPPLGADEAEVLPALKTHLDQSDERAEISYSIPRSAHVELSVYSADGRKVKSLVSEPKPAGSHTVYWNTSEVPSGIYICRLEADGICATEKMIRLK